MQRIKRLMGAADTPQKPESLVMLAITALLLSGLYFGAYETVEAQIDTVDMANTAEVAPPLASVQSTDHEVVRRALIKQLISDGMIASAKDTVTLEFVNNDWIANGKAVPQSSENTYCHWTSKLAAKGSKVAQINIEPKAMHVVSKSRAGQKDQIVTFGEVKHSDVKTKAKSLYKKSNAAPQAAPETPAQWVKLIKYAASDKALAFKMPVSGAKITSKFGSVEKREKDHRGVDLAVKAGTPVYASADGIVRYVKTEPKWGNRIIIAHEGGYQTHYGHLKGFKVQQGQTVNAGDVIGTVGSTGVSSGPHLHFEIRHNGRPKDPSPLIF